MAQKTVPMRWHGELGWTISVDKGMTPTEVQRAIDYTAKVQADRFVSLPPGERKRECLRTIQDLKMRKVHVNIEGTGDRVLFDAYKAEQKYWIPA